MADSEPEEFARDEVAPETAPIVGAPPWVKISGLVTLGLILLVVAVMVISGGEHGPGRHTGSGDDAGQAAPANATDGGHTPPAGGHTPPPGGHTP